jgi:Raf kinase inhibitor-like YbhB/YbcL family protein
MRLFFLVINLLVLSFAHAADKPMTITSPAFENSGKIPSLYSCDESNINPPLEFNNIPENTKSLVLILDDPDSPGGTWDHWIVWNIPVINGIEEDSVPTGAIEGMGSSELDGYDGPCPPDGTHRYFFKLYALDTTLDLQSGSEKQDVEEAMKGHIITQSELIGLYE